MHQRKIFLFSGQGCQYYHMGIELYKRQPVFRKWIGQLDTAASDLIGDSVIARVYDEKKGMNDPFDRLLYSHPAVFMVEYALAMTLIESGIEPDGTLGASLGEFAAASVSGILSPEEALEAVITQARFVESSCSEGVMLAVFHELSLYDEHDLLSRGAELAAINFRGHFVVSGERDAIAKIKEFLEKRGILSVPLPVRYGFHSPLIDPAGARYKTYLSSREYREPLIPLVSGVAGQVTQLAKEHFWDAARERIRLPAAIEEVEALGPNRYVDVTPGGTLGNFAKRCLGKQSESRIHSIITLFHTDMDNLQKLMRSCSR